MNVKYLQAIMRRLNRRDFWHEVLIAITTSSAVAGISFWGTVLGGWLWRAIGAVATILSVLKPLLRLRDKIKRTSELLASYHILDFDLNRIRIEIERRKKYEEPLAKQFLKALERKRELVKKDVESSIDDKLRVVCRKKVDREMPPESFYVPPD